MPWEEVIFQDADSVVIQSGGEWSSMQKEGSGKWVFKDVELECVITAEANTLFVTALETGVQRITMRWKQDMNVPVKLLSDQWERSYGDLEWRGIVSERVMPWYFLAYDGQKTWGYGVKTQPAALCFWMAEKDDVTLCMDLRCGGSDVMLSGRRICAASLVSICKTISPFEASRELCLKMCDKPKKLVSPVYGGNDWYYAYGNNSSSGIVSDAMRISELAGSNEIRPYMVVDAGWQMARDNGIHECGPWIRGNSEFPDMQRLANNIKREGCQSGIWFRPLFTSKTVKNARMIQRKNSPPVLDPSDEAVLQSVSEDVKRFINWGYTLIKHDFSTYDITGRWGFEMHGDITDDNWSFYDTHKTTAEIITQLYRTIQNAAGNALIIGCNTIGHLCAGIHDINRIGDDTSGREWERTRRMGVNTLAFRMPQHGVFFAADADCVGITKNIDWRLNEQWLSLLSESGTPLFVSLSPDAYGNEQQTALKKAFANVVKSVFPCQPVDWLETTCPSKWLLNGTVKQFEWNKIDRKPIVGQI